MAIGYTGAQAQETRGLLATFPDAIADPILALARNTIEILPGWDYSTTNAFCSVDQSLFANPAVRAAVITLRLIGRNLPLPPLRETRLGSEWELISEFSTSRHIIRQAIRVLGDFDMIHSRRGRNGGIFLKRPTPTGIVRQLFPYLAANQSHPVPGLTWLWALNIAHLRLAAAKLSRMTQTQRLTWQQGTLGDISGMSEPMRWMRLQQAISRLADNPLLDAIALSLVCHHVRCGSLSPYPKPVVETLFALEKDILGELAAGRTESAEGLQREAQERIAEVLDDGAEG
ncbi:MAG: hypothetical protein ABI240_05650 [Sphingomonas sp.]